MPRKIQVGDPAPSFRLPTDGGGELSLEELLAVGPQVFYFYPGDFQPFCTVEAVAFRDRFAELKAAGAGVVGISPDPPKSHRDFRIQHELPFPLLSDQEHRAGRAWGVRAWGGPLRGRSTFVVGRDGRVRFRYDSLLKPEAHVRRAIEFLKSQAPGRQNP